MIETSRTFLFTEYARTGCGTIHTQGTDPKIWDKLPVSCPFVFVDCWLISFQDKFSAYPEIKHLLQRVKEEKAAEQKRLDGYHGILTGSSSRMNGSSKLLSIEGS